MLATFQMSFVGFFFTPAHQASISSFINDICVLRVTHARCHAGAEQDQENGCHGCHFRKASRGCVFHKPRSEWTVWANLRCDFLNMSSKLTWEDSNKSFGHPPWLGWQPQISILPGLVNIQKTIETMAIEIVDLPINSMVIFHSYVNVYQRVSMKYIEISL